jgi:hypothetical protein
MSAMKDEQNSTTARSSRKEKKPLHRDSLKISAEKSFQLLVEIGVYKPNGQLTAQYGG